MPTITTMTAKEFRALGLLQELNRQFLHPLGLALEVIVEENGDERFGAVWDYRSDPEGLAFGDGMKIDAALEVDRLRAAHADARRQLFSGPIVQPIPGLTAARLAASRAAAPGERLRVISLSTMDGEPTGIIDEGGGREIELSVDGQPVYAIEIENELPQDGATITLELKRTDMTDAELEAMPET